MEWVESVGAYSLHMTFYLHPWLVHVWLVIQGILDKMKACVFVHLDDRAHLGQIQAVHHVDV